MDTGKSTRCSQKTELGVSIKNCCSCINLKSETKPDPFFFLNQQAYSYDLLKYSPVAHIQDRIEQQNKVEITKSPFVQEAANECNRISQQLNQAEALE